jgi:hypothetical protein
MGLGVIAVLYIVIGNIYILKEVQREEIWHEKAVANTDDQTVAQWRLEKGSQPVAEWFFVNEMRHTYVVRLFDDKRYVSVFYDQVVHAVGDPHDSPMPKRFESGKVSAAEWRAFDILLESMYENREQFYEISHRKQGNVTLAYSRDNATPINYRLQSNEYQHWPSTYREFDDHLFAAMESWTVKPHHGYSRAVPGLSYGPEDLPGLVRLLQSDNEAAYPGIVSRMVALGEPAHAELIEILQKGEETRYRPTSRYIAVMDGLVELGNAKGAGFAMMNSISKTPVSLPGRKDLKAHAAAIVHARGVKLQSDLPHKARELAAEPSFVNIGVPGLLTLMGSSDKLARMASFYVLEKDEYAAYSPQYIAQLDRYLDLYRASSSAAARDVFSEVSINLMKLLQKHDPANRNSIDVLLKAATDTEQAEQTRVMALGSLVALAPLPDAAKKQLLESAN